VNGFGPILIVMLVSVVMGILVLVRIVSILGVSILLCCIDFEDLKVAIIADLLWSVMVMCGVVVLKVSSMGLSFLE